MEESSSFSIGKPKGNGENILFTGAGSLQSFVKNELSIVENIKDRQHRVVERKHFNQLKMYLGEPDKRHSTRSATELMLLYERGPNLDNEADEAVEDRPFLVHKENSADAQPIRADLMYFLSTIKRRP